MPSSFLFLSFLSFLFLSPLSSIHIFFLSVFVSSFLSFFPSFLVFFLCSFSFYFSYSSFFSSIFSMSFHLYSVSSFSFPCVYINIFVSMSLDPFLVQWILAHWLWGTRDNILELVLACTFRTSSDKMYYKRKHIHCLLNTTLHKEFRRIQHWEGKIMEISVFPLEFLQSLPLKVTS